MAGADQAPTQDDDTPTVAREKYRDLLADMPPLSFAPQAAIARVIQQDSVVVGLCLDDAVVAELADAMLEALRDDEEAAIDLASFVFDADVRRALAS